MRGSLTVRQVRLAPLLLAPRGASPLSTPKMIVLADCDESKIRPVRGGFLFLGLADLIEALGGEKLEHRADSGNADN